LQLLSPVVATRSKRFPHFHRSQSNNKEQTEATFVVVCCIDVEIGLVRLVLVARAEAFTLQRISTGYGEWIALFSSRENE